MENLKVLWTIDGRRHVSVVAYDRGSADDRMARLRSEGATDVVSVSVKPGETTEVEQPTARRVVPRKHTVAK